MSPAVRIPTRFTSCFVVSLCITLFLIGPSGCSSGDSNPAGSGTSPSSPTPSNVQQTGQPGRFNERVREIISAPDATGDIYVVGDFTTYNGIPVPPLVRITPDGTLNENFKLQLNISLADSQSVVAIAPVDDGSGDIYVGKLESLAGQRARIWKLHPNGSVDGSFATRPNQFHRRCSDNAYDDLSHCSDGR
jgi:hypothetical protein